MTNTVPQAVAVGAASASASTNPVTTTAAAASPSSTTDTHLTPESANTACSSCGSEVNGMPMIQQPSLDEAEHREPSTTNMVPTAGTSASSSTSSFPIYHDQGERQGRSAEENDHRGQENDDNAQKEEETEETEILVDFIRDDAAIPSE